MATGKLHAAKTNMIIIIFTLSHTESILNTTQETALYLC